MLTPSDHSSMLAAYESVVDTLGVPATWAQTKDPQASADVVVGFRTVGLQEEAIINAFGIGAKVITVKVSDIPVVEKFDRFTITGERYTIDAVMPTHLNGTLIFHKCYVKGK